MAPGGWKLFEAVKNDDIGLLHLDALCCLEMVVLCYACVYLWYVSGHVGGMHVLSQTKSAAHICLPTRSLPFSRPNSCLFLFPRP